jgi:outer membrane PBP1 activator LpoA protein
VPLALVLPLESPLYGRAAEAVRAGFAAAAAVPRARYTVIAHGDGGVVAAFTRARQAGARVIVGPLVRDDLKAIAAAGGDLPWTIALNQLDESSALAPRIYTLALAVESEGVQLAQRAQADGARTVAIIGNDSALQQRFAGAFIGQWILQGGAPPVTFRLDRATDMLALLRREVAKAAPDAVLLALDATETALVRPYLGQVIAYTSSQVNDRQTPESLRDLDGVRFVELPWLADPGSPVFARIARPDYGSPTLERLYALGIDAFHVGEIFVDGAPATLELDGATGHLVLDRSGQFLRVVTLMQFRDGEIVPVGER